MNKYLLEGLGSAVVAVAAPIVVVAVSVLLFLNPIWVYGEQDRTGVDRLTGYSQTQVHDVTGSILADLVFGPPRFDATVNGQPVLDVKERQHMVDVRNVFYELGAIALVAAFILVAAAMVGWRRRWFWRGVLVGSTALIAGVVTVGLGFLLFFDQAFTLMHEIFFAPGSWTFAGSERLIQLFPDPFWSDTTVAVALAVLLLAIAAAALSVQASRRVEAGMLARATA